MSVLAETSPSPQTRSIVVLGASGSGKSSVVSAIRSPEYEDRLVIPRRVITLPKREDADETENKYVGRGVFRAMAETGLVEPWWERRFGESRTEFYGFEAINPDETRTVVYSANNSMVRDEGNEGVQALLSRSDIVMITAGHDECARRLSVRTPSMGEEERAARTSESDQLGFLFQGGNRNVQIIDNERPLQESQAHFIEFVLERTVASV